jgi:hypothetical protein
MSIFPQSLSSRRPIPDWPIVSEDTPERLCFKLVYKECFVGDIDLQSILIYRIGTSTFVRSGSACVNTGYKVYMLI